MHSARDNLTKHPQRDEERLLGGYSLKTTVLKNGASAGFAEIRLQGSQKSLYVDFCGAHREEDGYLFQNARMVQVYSGAPGKPDQAQFLGSFVVPRADLKAFNKNIIPYLDRVYGAQRASANKVTTEMFKDHELVTFSEWNFFARPQAENGSVFNIALRDGGATRVIAGPNQGGPKSPITLWQMYGETLKCLGFVQSSYDVLFGPGTAQRLGLSTPGGDVAAKINPSSLQQKGFTLFDPKRYDHEPPVGTFFRLQAADRKMATHVAICLGPDENGHVRIGHLICGKLILESWDTVKRADHYWGVETIAEPPKSLQPVISIKDPLSSLVDCNPPYLKGATLDTIVSDLRRHYPRFRAVTTELLTDVIYQFNRTKFAAIGSLSPDAIAGKRTTDHIGAHFKLRGDFSMSLPSALLTEKAVRSPRP